MKDENAKDLWNAGLDTSDLGRMSEFFKVISDGTRLKILISLLDGKSNVTGICEKVGMSQSAVSHQLAILRYADLVRVERCGKSAVYQISDEHVRLILDMALLHVSE